jgi:predicted small integral membrane protein
MGDLTGIFIVGFIVLGIYKLFELFVKKRERLLLIEKFSAFYENKEMQDPIQMQDPIHLPPIVFKNQSNVFGSLRTSLLLIGVGLGCLLAFFTHYGIYEEWENMTGNSKALVNNMGISVILSFIAIFGGIGLLIAYLVEAKQQRKNDKPE